MHRVPSPVENTPSAPTSKLPSTVFPFSKWAVTPRDEGSKEESLCSQWTSVSPLKNSLNLNLFALKYSCAFGGSPSLNFAVGIRGCPFATSITLELRMPVPPIGASTDTARMNLELSACRRSYAHGRSVMPNPCRRKEGEVSKMRAGME